MGVYWVSVLVAMAGFVSQVSDSGDSYSPVVKFMMRGSGGLWISGMGMSIFGLLSPSFICFWGLLPRWGIGARSWRLVLGCVSDAPQVPRCCHSWGNLST